MNPDPTNLLAKAGITTPLIGFYDLPDPTPFEPFALPNRCMRQHLPPDLLAFTVNRSMYKQLCELKENSFLEKSFWRRLQHSREEKKHIEI